MAQRDIEAIAEQMRLAEEAKHACEEAFRRMQEEESKLEAEEFEQVEDEIIDPSVMGFVDSETIEDMDESDPFYNEDECNDKLEEDVSDCIEQEEPIDESDNQGYIEVDVYNEDGFGEHFASEVMKNVPGVVAFAKKAIKPNGDILVKISGIRPDLEKAFAFYVGQKDYASLSPEDKEEFESLLVFDDGDTLAEADYREAVAHCLDPIDVNASTANLVAQDTCAINLLEAEKMRRKVKRINKALLENDLSTMSDKDIEELEAYWDTVLAKLGYSREQWDALTPEKREKVWKDHCDKDLNPVGEIDPNDPYQWTPEDRKFMEAQAKELGFTLDEFMKLTDEQREKVTRNQLEFIKFMSPSGTGFNYSIAKDPKTGKYYKYYNAHPLPDALGGGITAFNPFYTSADSIHQHPNLINKRRKEEIAKLDQERRDALSNVAKKKARGKWHIDPETGKTIKDTWNQNDWTSMIVNLSPKAKDQLMEELIDEVRREAPDKITADREEEIIKFMFGKTKKGGKLGLRNLGVAWGSPHTSVIRMEKVFSDALSVAMKKTVGETDLDPIIVLARMSVKPDVRAKFIKILSNQLNLQKLGKNPIDPERGMRHQDFLKIIRSMGYSPSKWDNLSTDKQLELMDKYYATHTDGEDAAEKIGYIAKQDN